MPAEMVYPVVLVQGAIPSLALFLTVAQGLDIVSGSMLELSMSASFDTMRYFTGHYCSGQCRRLHRSITEVQSKGGSLQ